MDTNCLVVLSGGMDSATLLGMAVERYGSTHVGAISFDYKQRHKRELESARALCVWYNIPDHKVVDLEALNELAQGSSLTSPDMEVPHGLYDAANMAQTVVPNRNMTFIALAGAYAQSQGYKYLWIGTHAGDHAIYPM